MGVGLKVASGSFNTFELVLYRGVVGGVSLAAWFYAIAHLPLATALGKAGEPVQTTTASISTPTM